MARVTHALTNSYSSVRFLFRIARLVKAHLIDSKLLYVFYYDEITGYLTRKLSFLIQWCGTGLDLAANYEPHELARIVAALIGLLKELNEIHEQNGADLSEEGHEALIARFEDRRFPELKRSTFPRTTWSILAVRIRILRYPDSSIVIRIGFYSLSPISAQFIAGIVPEGGLWEAVRGQSLREILRKF